MNESRAMVSARLGRTPWIVVVAALVAAVCSKKASDDKGSSAVLARVGDATITVGAFRAHVAATPAFSPARSKSLDRKKEILDGLIRTQLLAEEARRRHLDADPEVRAAIDRILVQRLTRAASEEQGGVPDADLRRAFDQRKSELVAPTRVRVAHLFIAAPEKGPERARAAAEAARLFQQIKTKEDKGEKQVLELTASQRSEDAATKATGGDLGFRTREELTQAWGAAFAEAALALKTTNQLGPVVATPRGVHLIKQLGRHEGYDISFEAARSRIEPALKAERQARAMDDLVSALKKKTKIDVDEAALAAVD